MKTNNSRCKLLTVDKPAIDGGEPMFREKLNIIRPTLFDPAGMMDEIVEIFSSGNVTVSKYVKLFEQECARYLGVKEAVAVSSATSGLILAVKALGLTGEVIVPSFTFTATVHSLIWNGLTPVFADCEEGTYNIDLKDVERKITAKTSAIMPVYIFGNPPRIKELENIAAKNNLRLIFDSAQAFGTEYEGPRTTRFAWVRGRVRAGGFGDCEVFSLSPTKVLTAIEGGLITTNNIKLAQYLRRARDYGKCGEDIECVGLSARMSELHALVGLKNLANVEKCLKTRRELIVFYQGLLKDIDGISFQEVLPGNKSSGNYMVIFIDEQRFGMSRDKLYEALKAENIETKKYFYPAVHLQEAYRAFRERYEGKMPVTEKASRTGLALPLYGHMEPITVEKVCQAIMRIHKFMNEKIEARR
ncbi:MAG: DegT/DnrJ/EryC1/StrS family aminotransferase [Candidatus Omnitrophota bacterium]